METLTQDSQHVDENSQHHEIEMLTPLLAKNKNMACQCMNAFVITYYVYY